MKQVQAKTCKLDKKNIYRFSQKYLMPGQMVKFLFGHWNSFRQIDVNGKLLNVHRELDIHCWHVGLLIRVDKRRKFIDLLIESDILRFQAQEDFYLYVTTESLESLLTS